ncbi:protection of telomeres protein 1b-like isoform X4 [Malania oleifera]|uniref:protection of telomeres protein 1b-like isoform X4 n=1 Tax=Malania oleifera TaxID=397392 RepID=UPI0025AEBE29|nr:protection of telomeres protein 1b-like isoform X4 [Malania oleifera]
MGMRDDYKFLQIKDALPCLNQKVNLIGVIVEHSVPRWTKGTDCFCSLKIIDESHQGPGITVNIFCEDMEKLPRVASAGDIILLAHIVMKNHGCDVYALFNKKFSAFALYEGKYCSDLNPYQISSKFHPRDQDKKFIAELREWLAGFQLEAGSKESSLLREIREGERFDLVCKILHKCEVTEDKWMIFVWDGTDAPPVTIQSKLEDEVENPLPLQLEPMPLSREILCTFPAVGTILRVIIDQGNEKLGIHLLNTGKWVRFVNIICEVHAGLWRGVIKPFTKLQCFPDEDPLILQRQRLYDERIFSKWERMPFTSFPWHSRITETDYRHVPFVTLMDVLTCLKVTAKFKCVVRAVAAYPWQAEDFCSPSGTYRIRLTLEDPTARIHAFVYAKDGEKFFEGYPPVDVLKRKRNKLLGVDESECGKRINDAPTRNPPWIECCLKSYYLVKTDAWGSRNYRIFGTKLVG